MSMVKNHHYDVDHEEDWDLDDTPATNYTTSLSRRALEMYGKPKRITVRTWDDCNNERFAAINLYQTEVINANDLMEDLLNVEYWIESDKILVSTLIHTVAVKLEAANRNHSILKHQPLEDDDLQDTLMLILETLLSGNPKRETATPWLVSMISSRVSNHLRNKMRAGRRGLGEDDFDVVSLEDLQGEDELDNVLPTPKEAYELESMMGLLNKLSPRQKEVMEMLIDGLSYQEIADDLDITVNTVDAHIQRARIKLAPSRAEYYKE